MLDGVVVELVVLRSVVVLFVLCFFLPMSVVESLLVLDEVVE